MVKKAQFPTMAFPVQSHYTVPWTSAFYYNREADQCVESGFDRISFRNKLTNAKCILQTVKKILNAE